MANAATYNFSKLHFAEGTAPATPDAGEVVIYAKTDGLLYQKDDAGTETLVAGGSGGAGGGTVPEWISYLAARQTGETSYADDDFFDNGTLAGTAVTPTGTATWTEKYGRMAVQLDSQGAFPPDICARAFAMTAGTPPVTLETRIARTVIENVNNVPGIYVGFSDGTATTSSVAALYMYHDATNDAIRFYDTSGTFAVPSGDTLWSNYLLPSPFIYVRAVWTASNTFEYAVSLDGIYYEDLGQAADSVTLTPTHYILGGGNTSSVKSSIAFDYLRANESDLSA